MRIVGLDRLVILALGLKFWNAVSGAITLIFLTQFLSPETQGYYYTLASLLSLQVFVELGLTYATIQFASHEMAALTVSSCRKLMGDAAAKSRLRSLFVFTLTWFIGAACLVMLLLAPAGAAFFMSNAPGREGQIIDPAWLWVILVLTIAPTLIVNVLYAILEGCGQVAQVTTYRLAQAIVSTGVLWMTLAAGQQIVALFWQALSALTVGALCLFARERNFFLDLWAAPRIEGAVLNWHKDVLPFQWRIAVSWIAGYLAFSAFSPIVFTYLDPVAAGRIGMSLQVVSAMNALAVVWITTKVPRFGPFIVRGDRCGLDEMFFRALRQSTAILSLALLSLLAAIVFLRYLGSGLPDRLVGLESLSVLFVACLANHIVFAEAAYLRAHKVEPFMPVSVSAGLVAFLLAVWLVPSLGEWGAVVAYSASAVLVGLGGGTWVFFNWRHKHI